MNRDLHRLLFFVFGFAQGWNIDIDSYRDPYEYGDDTGLKEKKMSLLIRFLICLNLQSEV